MAKFRFALEKVITHRKMLEDLAQKDFQLAAAKLAIEEKKIEELQSKRREAFENRYQKQVQGGQSSEALTQVHEFLQGQDLRIKIQQKKIQECEKQVEDLRSVLRARAVETKIIERLKERKKDEFVLEQKKLEQKKTDDITTARFRSKDATDEENGI